MRPASRVYRAYFRGTNFFRDFVFPERPPAKRARPTITSQDGFVVGKTTHGVSSLTIEGSGDGNTYAVNTVSPLTSTMSEGFIWDTVNGSAQGKVSFVFPLPKVHGK